MAKVTVAQAKAVLKAAGVKVGGAAAKAGGAVAKGAKAAGNATVKGAKVAGSGVVKGGKAVGRDISAAVGSRKPKKPIAAQGGGRGTQQSSKGKELAAGKVKRGKRYIAGGAVATAAGTGVAVAKSKKKKK